MQESPDPFLEATIEASEVAVVLGESRFCTRRHLLLRKVRQKAPTMVPTAHKHKTPAQLNHGSAQERRAIRKFENDTGKTVRVSDDLLRHPVYPWLRGRPDGYVDAERRIVEIKCPVKAVDMEEALSDYYHQIQAYLELTGAKEAYLVVYDSKLDRQRHRLVPKEEGWIVRVGHRLRLFHDQIRFYREKGDHAISPSTRSSSKVSSEFGTLSWTKGLSR